MVFSGKSNNISHQLARTIFVSRSCKLLRKVVYVGLKKECGVFKRFKKDDRILIIQLNLPLQLLLNKVRSNSLQVNYANLHKKKTRP